MPTSEQASDATRYVFLTSFSVLSAVLLRDVFMKIWEHLFLTDSQVFYQIILYQILLFLIVFGVTIIAAIFWTNYETEVI